MKLKKIVDTLEEFAPLKFQENYDNSGLIVGSYSDNIKGVLITLDVTEKIVDEAIKNECNLIIAHHPIIFKGLKKINKNNFVDSVIIKCIKNDISIYAIHTNLDNMFFGVNHKIADVLNLEMTDLLLSKEKNGTVGSGMIGTLKTPLNEKSFLNKIKNSFECTNIKHSKLLNSPIKTVAICGGAGSFLLNNAIEKKADAFITADVTYHSFFEANGDILLIDIGHYESEQFTKELIYNVLKNASFDMSTIHVSKINTNPVYNFN